MRIRSAAAQRCTIGCTPTEMDWDNARVFLAIYRHGTLRSAAADLGIDQATAARRLAALERALHARLFLRTPKGYTPTPAGEQAFRAAQAMEAAADDLVRRMQGLDDRLEGSVSIACTDTVAVVFLMPALRRLRERHPGIEARLIVSTRLSNLNRREADLALRPVRPDSPDLIARHLGRRAVALYASRDYLQRRGRPTREAGLAGHDLVVYPRELAAYQREAMCGMPVAGARIAVEVNTGLMLTQAVAEGLGIGEIPTHLAGRFPALERLWPDHEEGYDMWLVMHGDSHRTARVRAVADLVVEAFAAGAA
jgi:DNA-binding transcriptional LysR family regulator